MTIAEIAQRMIDFYAGSQHDICHSLKVYAYAKTIGELEHLDKTTQETLEAAALVHDIACPVCREKYGNANGKYQELESPAILAGFFRAGELPEAMLRRIVYLVSHHHTYEGVDGLDYQILLEADFLVNADESHASAAAIQAMREKVFRTKAGIALLDSMYLR